ncbi:MAG: STAS/SEC14 domain-containing protein [Chitinophagales bacterium]|nr:STAS/SEC14 domain-containing protein [Chitinophagales bacterium]
MVSFNETGRDDTIAIAMYGKLTKDDYDVALPIFKELIRRYEKIRVLFLLEGYDSMTLGAFAKEVKFDLSHRDSFVKIAFVGDKEKLSTAEKVAKAYFTAEVKLFGPEERQLAQQWVEG